MKHIILLSLLIIAHITVTAQEITNQKKLSNEVSLKETKQRINTTKTTYKKVILLSKNDTIRFSAKTRHKKAQVKIPDSLLYRVKSSKN